MLFIPIVSPEDKQWYRAQVLAYSTEKSVCVGYIDFGNSEEVDLNHLRPISPALLALPKQAISCILAGNFFRKTSTYLFLLFSEAQRASLFK